MTDHHSTREVLDDHLALAADHDVETDLSRTFGDDVVLLTGYGIFRGIEGVREKARLLEEQLPGWRYIESFGDSWYARVAKRWGAGVGPMAEWQASASYGSVAEEHHGETERTALWNVALRHARPFGSGGGDLYALVEASNSEPAHEGGYFSFLGETRAAIGRHQPYLRVEYASRPEYAREGAPGTDAFFRYDHHAEAIGATRWAHRHPRLRVRADRLPIQPPAIRRSAGPHRVNDDRDGIDPETLLDVDSFGDARWTRS